MKSALPFQTPVNLFLGVCGCGYLKPQFNWLSAALALVGFGVS
jgi:hypothetical protein